MRSILAAVALAALAGCAGQPDFRAGASGPVQSEASLDLDQYQGLWYEIARFPNRFERDCVGVTAEYGRRDDGLISVTNTCRKGALDGPVDVAEGKARRVGGARLEVTFAPVSFLPFVWGDYWVLDIDPDYTVSVVGDPSGRYGWILARTPQLSPERLEAAVGVLAAQGYDVSRLEFPEQFAESETPPQ